MTVAEKTVDFPTTSAPFMELVGPVDGRRNAAGYELSLKIDRHHVNAAGTGHGGLLVTLADLAIGNAVAAASALSPGATVSLSIDYLSPVQVGETVRVVASVDRAGGRLGFGTARLTADGRDVATARAWFAMRQ